MESPYLPVNIDSPETIIEWNYQNGKYQNDKIFKIIRLIFFIWT